MPKPRTYLTLDTSFLVLCISENENYRRQRPKAHHLPAQLRSFLTQLLGNTQPIWVLHDEQIKELDEVVRGIIRRSQAALAGAQPNADLIYWDNSEIINAQELLCYLEQLQNRLIGNKPHPSVCYGSQNDPTARGSLEIAGALLPEVRAVTGSDEFRDLVICAFSYAQAAKHPNASHIIIEYDAHFAAIKSAFKSVVERIDTQKPERAVFDHLAIKHQGRAPTFRIPAFRGSDEIS